MGVEFRILGPLELLVDGRVVPVGGPRQRALLATLLLSPNRVVSREHLVNELLADADPGTADQRLRVQVSRLRRVLEFEGEDTSRLEAKVPGYVLRVGSDELDLTRFEALLTAGRTALAAEEFAAAAEALRDAEALWRGRPMADLEFEPFARVEVERLAELRIVAAEARIDAELALGHHAALVPELESRVAEYPLRERPRAQLMLALYRSGRQADALAAYRSGRALLSEELALEPSPTLRALERSILCQEPELDGPLRLDERTATSVSDEARTLDAGPPGERPVDAMPRRRRLPLAAVGGALLLAAVALLVRLGSRTHHPVVVGNSVAAIDTLNRSIHAAQPLAGRPGGIAAGLGATWVSDTANDQLLELDSGAHIVERIAVGHRPQGVAVGLGYVWVVDQLDRAVSKVDPRADRQVASFEVGNGADAIAFGEAAAWVANPSDDSITRIDARSGRTATITLAGVPAGLAVGPDGVWVASASTGQLLRIDPRSDRIVQAEPIGNNPAGVAVGAGAVWVTDAADGTLSRFDPASGRVSRVNMGSSPAGVAVVDGRVWVGDAADGILRIFDPTSGSVTRVRVGAEPVELAGSGRRIWTTVQPAPGSHRGGTVRVAVESPYGATGTSVDPGVFGGELQWDVLSLTSDALVTYRRVGGVGGDALVPDLATGLPAPTDGGRTYTFTLRAGIRYSNGMPVAPEDFRRAIERLFRLGSAYPEFFYTGIVGAQRCLQVASRCSLTRGISVDDPTNTITFHLTAPDPDFLYKLAFPWAGAVPAGTPNRDIGFRTLPATGPYMTRSITPSQRKGPLGHPFSFHTWTLTRNPRFRQWSSEAQPAGYPDSIVLVNDLTPSEAVQALEQGRVDVVLSAPSALADQLDTLSALQVHSEPEAATFYLIANTRVPPFNRVAARRALSYAIDRARIAALAGGPQQAQPTCQILPPTMAGYQPYCPYTVAPDASGSWTGPDLAKAAQLIRASGTEGQKVTLLVQPATAVDPTATVGHYLVSVLDRLGYKASLRVVSDLYGTASDSRNRFQIAWANWYEDYAAPSDFIVPFLTCNSFIPRRSDNPNEAEFCARGIDTTIAAASASETIEPGIANQDWTRIDHQLADLLPWIPLYNPRTLIATSGRVGNYQFHPFWQLLFDQLWVR